jgi:hypothetical protein
MIVWGGETDSVVLNAGGRYDPSTNAWSATSTAAGVPSARRHHTAVWTGTEMIVWGGSAAGGAVLDSGGRYDPAIDAWSATSSTGAPAARHMHGAVWTGTEMVVWGGSTATGAGAVTGGRYLPAADVWTATSTTDAPAGRSSLSIVWTGSETIVWGGKPLTASGGLYCLCSQGEGAYRDADGDGYGDASGWISACAIPPGYVTNGDDCDDLDAAIHPGAIEICDGLDEDCNQIADDGIGAPTDRPTLTEGKDGATAFLSWNASAGATGYDVVKGNLGMLRSSAGNFTTSTTACLENDVVGLTSQDSRAPGPGAGLWHLVRAVSSCGGAGSYDEGSVSQQGSRDAEIDGSSSACP